MNCQRVTMCRSDVRVYVPAQCSNRLGPGIRSWGASELTSLEVFPVTSSPARSKVGGDPEIRELIPRPQGHVLWNRFSQYPHRVSVPHFFSIHHRCQELARTCRGGAILQYTCLDTSLRSLLTTAIHDGSARQQPSPYLCVCADDVCACFDRRSAPGVFYSRVSVADLEVCHSACLYGLSAIPTKRFLLCGIRDRFGRHSSSCAACANGQLMQ